MRSHMWGKLWRSLIYIVNCSFLKGIKKREKYFYLTQRNALMLILLFFEVTRYYPLHPGKSGTQ